MKPVFDSLMSHCAFLTRLLVLLKPSSWPVGCTST